MLVYFINHRDCVIKYWKMSSEEEYYVDLSCEERDTEYDKESINTEPVIINDNILGIRPYQFQPCLSDTDSNNECSESSEGEADIHNQAIGQDIQRLQNTEW